MLGPDVRLEWFVSFLAVIDTGSFVSAAEATKRSQPRVSMHVAALEREIGLPLFDRRKRPVALTDAGTALAAHARTILQVLESAEAAMTPWRDGARGVVTLGSYPSASAAFVPGLLESLATSSPEVKVVLVERSTLELDDALTSGAVDVYLRPMSPAPAGASARHRPLWWEPLVIVHPDDHPLAELPDPIPLGAVAEYPIVSIGRLDAPETVEFEAYQMFRECGHDVEPVQATNQPQTLIALVRRGIGVGVTNLLATQVAETNGVRVRRISETVGRSVAVCWDSSRPLTPAARMLLQTIITAPRPAGTEPVTTTRSETAVAATHSHHQYRYS